jgi:flagellar protein FlaG
MAQFSIAPLQSGAVAAAAAGAGAARATALPDAASQSSSKEELAYNRAVSAAVQTLNDSGYAGAGREVTISLDQATRRPVIKVVDTATNEVIQQWPTQYVLQLAADSQKSGRDSG